MSRELEAEGAVLGALMLSGEAYWKVADLIRAEDFADGDNAALFALIRDLVKEGKPADSVTIGERDESLYGLARDYESQVPSVAAVMAYAGIVRDRAEKRRLRRAGQAIAGCESYEAAQALLAAVRPSQSQRVKSAMDGIAEMVDALQRRYDATGAVSGVPTGIESLDLLTSGWQAGDLIICAARPSMGKTIFALQAALAAGRSLIFSLEMTAGKLIERAVSHVGHIPHRWIRFPTAPETPTYAGERICDVAGEVGKLPLLIDDSSGLTVDAICSRARQAHMAEPLRLIVVDHLGLISRPGKHDPSELGQITTQLKGLAKTLGVPVLLLCQLNRGLESRNDKRPLLSDLRDSGRIEEDADTVIALYRDWYYNPPKRDARGELPPHYLEILIRKARDGELGTAWAIANLSHMRLESCEQPESAGQAQGDDQRGGFQARSRAGSQPRAVA
jgi:replicative DNA helicase